MYNRIELTLAPSTLTGALAAGPWVFLAIVALGITVSGYWPLVPLPIALVLMARHRWRQNGSLSAPGAVAQLITRGERLFVQLGHGGEEEVLVADGSRVSGHYLVLDLRGVAGNRRYPVILLPAPRGNAPPDALRRLRVWLRLMPRSPAPMMGTPWHKNFLQHIWSGGKTHEY